MSARAWLGCRLHSSSALSISGATEPVWLGWLEAGHWHDACTGDHIGGTVVAWADVPEGFFPRLDDATPGAPA